MVSFVQILASWCCSFNNYSKGSNPTHREITASCLCHWIRYSASETSLSNVAVWRNSRQTASPLSNIFPQITHSLIHACDVLLITNITNVISFCFHSLSLLGTLHFENLCFRATANKTFCVLLLPKSWPQHWPHFCYLKQESHTQEYVCTRVTTILPFGKLSTRPFSYTLWQLFPKLKLALITMGVAAPADGSAFTKSS